MSTKPLSDLSGTFTFDPEVMDEMEQSEPTVELEIPFADARLVETVILDSGLAGEEFLDDIDDSEIDDILEQK